MEVVVAGVDYSQDAMVGLRFALDEPKLRHARLRIVHAWHYSYPGAPGIRAPSDRSDVREAFDAAETELEEAARAALPDTDSIEVEQRVVEGRPAAVLVEESRGADLLFVRSRGHGGFTELLLGSVSRQAARYADCPVVVVPRKKGSS